MANKGKFWSKLFKEKDKKETGEESAEESTTESEQDTGNDTKENIEELPTETCRFCYDSFTSGESAYKCKKCNTIYHFPKCLKNQANCRVCGDLIVEFGNIVKLIKFRSVVCPKCGMKIKLFYGPEPKLRISCPSCAHEGILPNPYLKGEKTTGEEDDEDVEFDEAAAEEVEDDELEDDDAEESDEEVEFDEEDAEEIDIDLEGESDFEPEDESELNEEDSGPKIIRPGKSKTKKRKAKLVVLEQSITCNVCLGTVKTGLPVVVCRCGKKYHETCATRVGECPTCDAGLKEIESLIKEEPKTEISEEDLDAIVESDETESELEPEPELEVQLEFLSKLNEHNTFDSYTLNDRNRIIHTIAFCIAKAPAKEFNLIYMYGSGELGKTHLLHAIGNHILNNESSINVRYTSIANFNSELEKAIEIDKEDDFEEHYIEADVLLVDDFHEIPKNKKTQETFFKIFDILLESNKQILLVGDRSIDEIKALNKNLITKINSKCGIIINLFESGLGNS